MQVSTKGWVFALVKSGHLSWRAMVSCLRAAVKAQTPVEAKFRAACLFLSFFKQTVCIEDAVSLYANWGVNLATLIPKVCGSWFISCEQLNQCQM